MGIVEVIALIASGSISSEVIRAIASIWTKRGDGDVSLQLAERSEMARQAQRLEGQVDRAIDKFLAVQEINVQLHVAKLAAEMKAEMQAARDAEIIAELREDVAILREILSRGTTASKGALQLDEKPL